MKNFLSSYIQLIILFSLAFFFTAMIGFSEYPDYLNLEKRLKNNFYELDYTLQKFLILTINFFNKNEIITIKNFTNFTFFLPTFFLCCLLILFSSLVEAKNDIEYKNFYFLTTLCFPSVLLSITSTSSEAVYTVISIFIMSRINFHKGAYSLNMFSALLLVYAYTLDRGNFTVLASFLFGYIFLSILRKFLDFKFFLIVLFSMSIIIFYYGIDIFIFLGSQIEAEKIINIMGTIQNLNLSNVSLDQLILRVGYFWITLTSLNFGDKKFSLIFFLFMGLFFFILFNQLKNKEIYNNLKKYFLNKYHQVLFIWIFLFPFIFINILPTHAYAKYYLFYVFIFLNLFGLIFKSIYIYISVVFFSILSVFERIVFL